MKKVTAYAGIGIMLAGAAFFAYKASLAGKADEPEENEDKESPPAPSPSVPASPAPAKANPAYSGAIQASHPSVSKAVEAEAKKQGLPPPFITSAPSTEDGFLVDTAKKGLGWFG